MTVQVKFYGVRPESSAPLWWDSEDTAIAEINNSVLELTNIFEITHSVTIAEDGLSYESIFVAKDQNFWQSFSDVLISSYPEMLSARDDYFRQNNHTIAMVMTDVDSGEVLQERLDLI